MKSLEVMKLKNRIITLIQTVVVAAAVLGLASCAHKQKTVYLVPKHKPSIKEIRESMIDDLGYYGKVQVIQTGEDVRIVLRSDYLFEPDSANIQQVYKPVLRNVARLLKTYDKINVKVAAYSDNQGKKPFLQALTTRQAQVVSNFLWDKGIDTRLLYAVGYSQLNPVDWNGSLLGQSFNRRVEISFRYFPKMKSYE